MLFYIWWFASFIWRRCFFALLLYKQIFLNVKISPVIYRINPNIQEFTNNTATIEFDSMFLIVRSAHFFIPMLVDARTHTQSHHAIA